MGKLLFFFLFFILTVFPSYALSQTCPPGDADGNCTVDGIDYVVWLNNYNQNVTGSGNGDFDGNGFVDGIDYVIWLNNYGQVGTTNPSPTNIPQISASCLTQTGLLTTVSGSQTNRMDLRSQPLAANAKIDAKNAIWTANWPVQDSFDYPVLISGGPNLCFSGGKITGNYPEEVPPDANAIWELMHGTSAMKVTGEKAVIENVRIHNYGDGIGFEPESKNFTLKSIYLSKIRDDCVENDWLNSGTIEDSLFDGCYSAFSARTYSGQDPQADGSNNLLTIRNSLIRLEATAGVYKNRGLIPGHDGFFKWDDIGISPKLSLHNNIFRVDQEANNVGLGLPQGKLIDCSNNIMVWLGQGPFPEDLPTESAGQPCFTVTSDKSVWDTAVDRWKTNHPGL